MPVAPILLQARRFRCRKKTSFGIVGRTSTLTVPLAVKNVTLDPVAMFDRLVADAAGWACYGACRDWTANFGDRAGAPVATCLQIFSIFRHAHRRTSRRAYCSTRREACPSPASLMQNLLAMMMMFLVLGCTLMRRRSGGAGESCANQHHDQK